MTLFMGKYIQLLSWEWDWTVHSHAELPGFGLFLDWESQGKS